MISVAAKGLNIEEQARERKDMEATDRIENLKHLLGDGWYERFCGLSLYRECGRGIERCTVWWMDGLIWDSSGIAGAPDSESSEPRKGERDGNGKEAVWDMLIGMLHEGWFVAEETRPEGRVAFRVMRLPRGNGAAVVRHNPDGTKRCEKRLDMAYPACYNKAIQIVSILKKHERTD